MAIITAVRSGNWSDTSHVTGPWPGGATPTTKPGIGDTVQTDEYIITIDEDVHVVALQKTAAGKFYVGAIAGDALEIVANIENPYVPTSGGSGEALEVAEIEEKSINVTGNVSGGSAPGSIGIYSTLTPIGLLTGNVSGGSGQGAYGIYCSVDHVIGNVIGGSGTGSHGIHGSVSQIDGDVACGAGVEAYGVYCPSVLVIVDGVLTWNNGYPPIQGLFKLVANPANAITVTSSTDTPLTLSNDYPAEADVKSGVEYNRGTMTGEMAAGGSIGPVSIVIGGGGIRIS